MTNILVTGIGGTRSIAVLKALRMSNEDYRVIGTDTNYLNAGSLQCDAAYIIPHCTDEEYIPSLKGIVTKENIDIIFATTEKEVTVLALHKDDFKKKYNVPIVVPDPDILEICFNKYKTQEYLKKNGLSYIPTIYADNTVAVQNFVKEYGFPVIRKPIHGYGSKGVTVIRDQHDLSSFELSEEYVLQRYIENEDNDKFGNLELNEFTAEIFVHPDKSVAGGIILKRALSNGETIGGYLIKNSQINSYLTEAAKKVGILGPINFQFRVADGNVYIFEINPLFSGTTAIRASLGFNSVHLAVRGFCDGKYDIIPSQELKQQYFIRYLNEVFIDPEKIETLKEFGYISNEE